MLERASPVQLRKALELANLFVKMGVNFVPVPVASDEEQHELVSQALDKLAELEKAADEAEGNSNQSSGAPSTDQASKGADRA
jgi:hypothetical protein